MKPYIAPIIALPTTPATVHKATGSGTSKINRHFIYGPNLFDLFQFQRNGKKERERTGLMLA
jgi:hypothetical protein